MPVTMEALSTIKKGIHKHINITWPSRASFYRYKKLHFAVQFIFFGEYYQSDWKISPKRGLLSRLGL